MHARRGVSLHPTLMTEDRASMGATSLVVQAPQAAGDALGTLLVLLLFYQTWSAPASLPSPSPRSTSWRSNPVPWRLCQLAVAVLLCSISLDWRRSLASGYGWFCGPGAIDDLVDVVRKRQFPVVGGGTGYSSWVHLDDAASATVLAVEQQVKGVFNIVDDEPAPASEWLPYLAACAGAKPPMRVPKWLARPLAGQVAVTMMTEGRGFSNAKARRELGWELRYPSWRQGFKAGLA